MDASNAFNALNRTAATNNMQYVCPPLAKYFENTYREPTDLYVANSEGVIIKSCEGFTQGDNIATGGYALSTKPLFDRLRNIIKQVWIADDSAAGKLKAVYKWWKELLQVGPKYGYFPNPSKSILVVKDPQMIDQAKALFGEFNIQITSGTRHLGDSRTVVTFTLAVFITSGGISNECKQFINRLADLIARKRKERHCDVVRNVRTRIRFTMLRTTLIALRGYRGKNMDCKYDTPLSEVSYNLIPAPLME